jgi:hypothetical protein
VRVSVKDSKGVEHAVEVEVRTLADTVWSYRAGDHSWSDRLAGKQAFDYSNLYYGILGGQISDRDMAGFILENGIRAARNRRLALPLRTTSPG